MNPVIVLTRNCLALTQRAIESIRRQDIPTSIFVFDNGSRDGTVDWIDRQGFAGMMHPDNKGVSYGWNTSLSFTFEGEVNHCLVINNDIALAPWAYRVLLSYNEPFITGVATDNLSEIGQPELPIVATENHPDFSCFLIRREAWNAIGKFDESMKLYASDCDYHVRGNRLGVRMVKACVPFYHERSSTVKHAPPEEQAEICRQADADRATFKRKYGCEIGSKEYEILFA